jgi:phosphoglycolate phosphatase
MNNHPRHLLVFDWDGTLIDSIARIVSSLQYASESACGVQVSEAAARNVIGLGLREAVEQLHPGMKTDAVAAVSEAYKQHFMHQNPIEAPLFEGVVDMLDDLRTRGYKLAIATGKSRIGLDHSLQTHKLAHYFSTTRCAGENPSKPHPQMLLGILGDTGTRAEHALMIGDSEHDLLMAKNAGVDAIAVTHGVHKAEVLLRHTPLACFDQITELSGFLSHNPQVL